MGQVVTEGAVMMCDMGDAPMALTVTSQVVESIDGLLVATVMDCVPMDNIPPFGTCTVLTSVALGVPTPCVPAPTGPWSPGSLVSSIDGLKVLTAPGLCQCGVGGSITISEPGEVLEQDE